MSRRRLLAIGVAIPAAIVAALIMLTEARWVGSTKLELVFAVCDSQTSRPIEGATIRALPETTSGCCDEPASEFALVTDAGGEARLRCQGCKCSGTKGLLRDTFGVAGPLWHFRVEAPGYSSTGWLHTGDYLRDVRRIGGGRSGLTIGIELAERSPNLALQRTPAAAARIGQSQLSLGGRVR